MNFEEAKKYINSLNKFGSVLGLDSIKALCDELSNPEDSLKFIHVTGTNGKGSTCAFLTSILKASGIKAGSYNSPAVICEYDQYRIDDEIIDEDTYAKALTKVSEAVTRLNERGISPTRFEVETAMAFVMFKDAGCELVVIETGLGGRDDATNVIKNTILHVFATISLDHVQILGNTLEEIAEVKSGIIKSDAKTVIYNLNDSATDVIIKRAKELGSECVILSEKDIADNKYTLSLKGEYQKINSLIAVSAVQELRKTGYDISDEAVRNGLMNAHIPFRFEVISDSDKKNNDEFPVIILDGAHNEDGARMLIKSLKSEYPEMDYIFITGIFKDKDYEKIASIVSEVASEVIVTENDMSDRALSKELLTKIYKKYTEKVSQYDRIEKCIDIGIEKVRQNKNAVLILSGSLSWLSRAKEYIKHHVAEDFNV